MTKYTGIDRESYIMAHPDEYSEEEYMAAVRKWNYSSIYVAVPGKDNEIEVDIREPKSVGLDGGSDTTVDTS